LAVRVSDLNGKVIFHVGNIANNAFNAAQYERQLGLCSFVISPNYYHVMSFPFWETEHLKIQPNESFNALSFSNRKNTPEWFLYGNPRQIYLDYLKIFSNNGQGEKDNASLKLNMVDALQLSIAKFLGVYRSSIKKVTPLFVRRFVGLLLLPIIRRQEKFNYYQLFRLADIIVFYGSYNAYAELCDYKSKYISLEHGTLREYVFGESYFSKASAKAYLNSFRVIITNQDCLLPALKLGVNRSNIIKAPHPTQNFDFVELRKLRLEMIGAGVKFKTIIYPARHSYTIEGDTGKGNKQAIEALLNIAKAYPDINILFSEWGTGVEESKRHIDSMGLTSQIQWNGLLSRRSLKFEMAKSLAVIDQFELPAFGAITGDALGLGVPVITKQDPLTDLKYFGSLAPVYAATTSEEIFAHLVKIVENEIEMSDVFTKYTKWYDDHLSARKAFDGRMIAYQEILNPN